MNTHEKMRKTDIMSQGVFGMYGSNKNVNIIKSAFDGEKIPKPVDLSVPREIIREEE